MTGGGQSESAGRGLTVAVIGAGVLLVLVFGAVGYGVGLDQAPDEVDAVVAESESFDTSFARSLESSRLRAEARGVARGRDEGSRTGGETGAVDGAAAGEAAAAAEVERVEAERAAAEAAAAEAAELALPEPCRGMPDSTARRMCIAAVERGDYP